MDLDFFPNIGGIKHVDRASSPVTVKFLKGGVNSKTVTIKITGPKGIKSSFYFYGKE